MANNHLKSFGLIPGLAAIVGFVIACASSLLLLRTNVDEDHQETLTRTLASSITQQVNIREGQIINQVSKVALSSVAVDAILEGPASIISAETKIAEVLPFAEQVRLIPLGEAKTDQGYPPFTFIALDMVKGVETGELIRPEAISTQPQLEGEKWITMAAPVKRGEELLGTLFIYLGTKAISTNITDGKKGEAWIMQSVGTELKMIAMSGSAGTGTAISYPLSNPNWTLHFSPSAAIANNYPAGIVFYILPGLAMLLITLGGVAFGAIRMGVSIQENLSMLGNQIARVASGSYDNKITYTLPGFADQDSKLKQLLDYGPAKVESPEAATVRKQSKRVLPPKESIVEIEMADDDSLFEEVEEFEVDDFESAVREANKDGVDLSSIEHIFRAYDIRGIVGESLSEDIARQIGLAIGSEAGDRGEQSILVGYDGREYSPALAEALIEGLTGSGRDVINIGAVPTPVLYFATHNSDAHSGVMVTGSHNAPDYNGFKIVLGKKTLVEDEIKALFQRVQNSDYSTGNGKTSSKDFIQDYIDAITDDVVVAQPLKVVIDCGNGIAGEIAPELLDSLGCEAIPLYCEVDGSFPNHHPDPTKPANLKDLITTVKSQGADLGIGLDGDGDRLVAVTADGDIVWPDRLLMLFAKDIVSRNPGSDIVYDVKCTRHLNSIISGFGGRPIISRSGHSFVKQKMTETDALLGGEFSGHICFAERWFGFDDGLYSTARLLEIVGSQEEGLAELLAEFPSSVATPEIHLAVSDDEKFVLIDSLVAAADFEDASITTIDGLRVDFADGWGLVRASNTEPALTLRFEADTQESLEDIKGAFRELLQELKPELEFD